MVSKTDKKQQKEIDTLKKQNEELKKEVEAADVNFIEFTRGSEEYRKRVLKENYEKFKEKYQWQYGQTIPVPGVPPTTECPEGQHWDEVMSKCVPDTAPLPPGPVEPPVETGDVLFDSHRDTNLHDSNVRTIDKSEGAISPNGLGIEMHASGSPKVVVNDDGTFSLICGAGHGRFYGFTKNYDSTLEIEAAFWNVAKGQDLSLKTRSRHNEGGAGPNRFGGYGLSIDRTGYDAKRETFHNEHDQAKSGKLPVTPKTGEYFTIRWTVKDQGDVVRQIGEMNGQAFLNKVDDAPKDYMVNKALYDQQSYFWVRQNIDSGTGEIRIKNLRILKA
jgi:hypothetical protein